tara:strand:- start:951 stop:1592 length:642 start_codon:yes stop_codon:yes gene_type:complete
MSADIQIEHIPIADLKPHPQNYREHPDDQLEHIMNSIKSNGYYRNVVVANDNTILAGHGVVKASKKMDLKTVPVVRLEVEPDSPQAKKVLTGDNEIAHLGEIDDRLLSEILKDVKDSAEDGLLGTGYDEKMLANLVMVTRPQSEIEDFNAAAEWVGMPDYDEESEQIKITVNFLNETDMNKFFEILDIPKKDLTRVWYPAKPKDDMKSVKFEK